MDWDIADFAVFIALIIGVTATYTLAARKTGNPSYRSAIAVALAAAFILVWVNGAVGIIGNEGNEANLMYIGVLAIPLIGAIMARFQPQGMARALYATALAQAVVAVIVLIAGWGSTGPVWPRDILILSAFFTALWLISAWLFRSAARDQNATSPKA